MRTEGMVHALRRVREMLAPEGLVVDLHPTAEPAVILVDGVVAGPVESPAGLLRHQAATDAIEAALTEGLYAREDATTFLFHTWADSVEELRDYILTCWRDTAIAETTLARARARMTPGARLSARERISVSRLAAL